MMPSTRRTSRDWSFGRPKYYQPKHLEESHGDQTHGSGDLAFGSWYHAIRRSLPNGLGAGNYQHQRPSYCRKYSWRVGYFAGRHISEQPSSASMRASDTHPLFLIYRTRSSARSEPNPDR